MTNASMMAIVVDTIFVVKEISTTMTNAVLHVVATLTQIVKIDGSVV